VCVCVLFASDVFALCLSTDSQVLGIKYLSRSNSYALNNSQRTAAKASPYKPRHASTWTMDSREQRRDRLTKKSVKRKRILVKNPELTWT